MAQPVLRHRVVVNVQAEAEGSAGRLLEPLANDIARSRTRGGPFCRPAFVTKNILALSPDGDDAPVTVY